MSADRKGKKAKAPACPVCGRPRVAKHRPFCSSRCTRRDLGHWLQGSYRIPTNEEPGDMDGDPDTAQDGPDQKD